MDHDGTPDILERAHLTQGERLCGILFLYVVVCSVMTALLLTVRHVLYWLAATGVVWAAMGFPPLLVFLPAAVVLTFVVIYAVVAIILFG